MGFSMDESAEISASLESCMFFRRCMSLARRTCPMHRSTLSTNHRLPYTGTIGMHRPAMYPQSSRILPPDIIHLCTFFCLIFLRLTSLYPSASISSILPSFSTDKSSFSSSPVSPSNVTM